MKIKKEVIKSSNLMMITLQKISFVFSLSSLWMEISFVAEYSKPKVMKMVKY